MMTRLWKAILLGLLVGIAGLVISPFRFMLSAEENIGMGLLFSLRGASQAPSDAVVVSIDKESAEKLNLPDNPDKWPRSLHARLTENLIREGARVIAFDVHFIEPRSPQDDVLFAKAMRMADNVILCEPLKTKEISAADQATSEVEDHNIVKVVQPIALFSRSAVATAPFTLPRIPFKVNRYWTFETGAGDSPTMPVIALQLFSMQVYGDFIRLLQKLSPNHAGNLPVDGDIAIRAVGIKKLIKEIRAIFENDPSIAERMLRELDSSETLSVDVERHRLIKSLIDMYEGANNRYINYYGHPGTVTTIPYYQALQLREGAASDKQIDVRNKAVFVGLSEVLLAERKDSFYTVFSRANGTFIGGVEIMATAFSNLLADTPVKPIGLPSYIGVILLWGILAGIICRMFPVGIAALGIAGMSVLYLVAAEYLFKHHSWYPVVIPLFLQVPIGFFGAVIWNYIDINKERQNIKTAFEHYLPKDVVDHLAKDIAFIKTGSRVVYGICLFTDAQHYTSLSETMDPHELGVFMNKYYEAMFKPVKQNGGFVSGVIGDSMLALWVSASSEISLKNNACLAVLDIRKALQQFEQSPDGVQLKTRIGLHCGQILLGHIGALDHYEYTPMGDIVNTASRIESLNKQLGTNTLVSEEVINQLNGFLTRELGKFRLKGKVQPIVIYELMGRLEESDEKCRKSCTLYAEAMDAFRMQGWDDAIRKFNEVVENLGKDGPSQFYIRLAERYKEQPPEETWEGVVRMDKK
jgi:adenylate cyclase